METLLLLSIALIGAGLLTAHLGERARNGWIIGWFIVAAGLSGSFIAGYGWVLNTTVPS